VVMGIITPDQQNEANELIVRAIELVGGLIMLVTAIMQFFQRLATKKVEKRLASIEGGQLALMSAQRPGVYFSETESATGPKAPYHRP
jgi:ribonuclease PH